MGGLPTPADAAAQVFVDDLTLLELSPDDAHHLGSVLRLRAGELVVASDGVGSWRMCEVAGARRRAGGDLALVPVSDPVHEPAPSPAITVAFALTKGERPEWAVQKLTEVGVDCIVPLVTERSVVRPDRPAAAERAGRFRRVAREAAMQSRRVWLPEISEVTTLADFLLATPAAALAAPDGEPPSLARPAVAIGPEGGFTAGELGDGRHLVSLGPHVLRGETAAVTAGALLVGLRYGLVDERGGAARRVEPFLTG